MSMDRADAERIIQQALVAQWDPMESHEASTYVAHAHELYSLLARGASDIQVGRYLHHVEKDVMGHPDADSRDLTALLHTLRHIEKTM